MSLRECMSLLLRSFFYFDPAAGGGEKFSLSFPVVMDTLRDALYIKPAVFFCIRGALFHPLPVGRVGSPHFSFFQGHQYSLQTDKVGSKEDVLVLFGIFFRMFFGMFSAMFFFWNVFWNVFLGCFLEFFLECFLGCFLE